MKPFVAKLKELLERLRFRLAGSHGGLTLALLGAVSGLVAGAVILLFRALVEGSQGAFLPGGGTENYEDLTKWWRFWVPVMGGLAIGVLIRALSAQPIRVGVLHVMERLSYFEGHLPWRNAVVQFFGGALALISGQSVGREGPCIHLGAASASNLGVSLGFPNNSIRTLVACGSAAAIAASFNTPLAGVIFAMEVVMMEYTIAGFTPVILAAVSATVLSQSVYGSAPAFLVPQFELSSLAELPYIVLMGIVVGCVAGGFIRLLKLTTGFGQRFPIWQRTVIAGLVVGLIGLIVPQIMGIGYDTVDRALLGSLGLGMLVTIAVCKLLVTAVTVGFGIPAGFIGPALVIGAACGGALGLVGQFMGSYSSPGLYAMLGMGAMMGATLQAPLAALLALLELTGNPNIILPAMLAIVSANLAAGVIFRTESVFLAQMRELGIDYKNDPISQSLRRQGVAAVMSRSFVTTPGKIQRDEAIALLENTPQWIVINRDNGKSLLPASDLARYLEAEEALEIEKIDLMEIPAQRLQLASIHPQATLQQAQDVMRETETEALYVVRPIAPLTDRIFGVLGRADIEAAYRIR